MGDMVAERRAATLILAVTTALLAGACDAVAPTGSSGSSMATAPPAASSGGTNGPTDQRTDTPTNGASTLAPSASVGASVPRLALTPVVGGLDSPVDLAWRPGDPGATYIVEQVGRIRLIRDGRLIAEPVLDITAEVTAGGEQGMLGLAFPPDPADTRLYVYYTASDGAQVVSSFRLDPADGGRARPGSEVLLLRMADQFPNHNGGSLAFGPDGYLYIGTGDGGGGGDPLGSGRDLGTLLAKILRIDVARVPAADGPAFSIPPDNPFVGRPGAQPEIWHTGLRNPWRFRFDRATGDLWIGDVGQGAWEEIDHAPVGAGGLDFGWNVMEGTHCFSPAAGCDETGLTMPVSEYGHDEGCSVTGGTVYRGRSHPDLVGRYVFADYCSGRVWTLDAEAVVTASDGALDPSIALDSGRSLSAIAEDQSGELYATDHGAGELLRFDLAND